jgi:hypothetical protein
MKKDAVLSKLKCYVHCRVCDRKFQDQSEVIFVLEQMIPDDVFPNMWWFLNGNVVNVCCHDLI